MPNVDIQALVKALETQRDRAVAGELAAMAMVGTLQAKLEKLMKPEPQKENVVDFDLVAHKAKREVP